MFGLMTAAGAHSTSARAANMTFRASPIQIAQVTVRQTIIVRIPVRPDSAPIRWVEKGNRKCIDIDAIAGASAVAPDALDLILRGGERWRLKFRDECPAIGFYRGFYLRPGEKRQICAKRDAVHLRSGGECEIQTFKRLQPEIDD